MTEAKGEGGVMGRLYRRENPVLVRFLVRMTRCRAAAEDLAQMAWLKLIHARRRGLCDTERDAELRSWLFEVARNTFIDEHTRKHAGSRTRATDPAVVADLAERLANAPSAEDETAQLEVGARLAGAINALPPPQREVIVMWCAGTSIEGMVRRCAAPRDTVLSRKKYALARMRQSLAPLALGPG